MAKKNLFIPLDQPIPQPDHARPKTRREFLAQGFSTGVGTVATTSVLGSLLASPAAMADLSTDMLARLTECGLDGGSSRKIPFIHIDLAGGANMAGSNVLVGGQGGQMDFLSAGGYSKQGLPGDMVPGALEAGGAASSETGSSNGDHTDTSLGLAFHSDSAFLRGIHDRTSELTRANINGAVIPARSENDTGNNPHNPLYGIARIGGATGSLLGLIGSRNSESGGNSMAPAQYIQPDLRPSKIDRPSDVTGLVSVGDFGSLSPQEVVYVMESVARMSKNKTDSVNTLLANDSEVREKLACTYVENASLADQFPNIDVLNVFSDPDIVGPSGIFSSDEMNDREFSKTASVMKLVLDSPANGYPYAGAGTIAMGGYDYHGGGRSTGEVRDFRAGRCMGACLEYAARKGRPLMLYVSSDGSLSSNGATEDGLGRGKGMWTSDNQQTAASFFLVYNPGGRPQLIGASEAEQARHQQIGYMRGSGDVETGSSPAANNVDQLVQMVLLNYMALHGEQGQFAQRFNDEGLVQGLGSSQIDNYTAFEPIVNGQISNS
ncbi:general secretion pathway protein GspF [Agaribacterium haliotis]|uniref:general secretion pathway protein GspF n=1 Tax=Agaribacterium haliotis TaxID=2013869 RepID=UPI000BB533A6|nr:general secretion pathway protein GspF [Agaribacterium haliotis]